MLSTHIPDEVYQLAAKYELGKPISVYRTDKRPYMRYFGWATAITYLFFIIVVLTQTSFRFAPTTFFLYSIAIAIMLVIALLWLIPLILIRKTTVSVYSAGFLLHHKATDRVVRWEEVEWVQSDSGLCVIHLADKQRVIISRFIGNLDMLAQEIELKARLVRRPEGQGNLEVQFEHLRRNQAARRLEKEDLFQEKQRLLEKESVGEALHLQEAYPLGAFMATYHGGFKGLLRTKAIALPLQYLLVLVFLFLLIGQYVQFRFLPGGSSLVSTAELLYLPLFLASSFFLPRFSARFLRLHLYTEDFVLIDGGI